MLKNTNLLIAALALIVSIIACNGASAVQPTPAAEVEATAEAEQPENDTTADDQPTDDTDQPDDTEDETEQAADTDDQAEQDGETCDYNAAFVADATYPDGSEVEAGSAFVKTWTLENSGCAMWGANVSAVYMGGTLEAGSGGAFNASVESGQQADLSVQFTAPQAAGSYEATYQLHANGQPFGTPFYVQVAVPVTDIAPPPSDDDDPGNPGDVAPPSEDDDDEDLIIVPGCLYSASVVERDPVTITKGDDFTLSITLYNGGGCDWEAGTELYTISGDPILVNGVYTLSGSQLADAGQTVVIEMDGTAPTTTGSYSALIQLRNAEGTAFGPKFTIEVNVIEELIIMPGG